MYKASDYFSHQVEDCPQVLQRRLNECKQEQTPHLNLTNLMLLEIPDEVFEFEWLESLDISGVEIDEYGGSFEDIDLSNNFISIPARIASFKNLKRLKISDNSISDLSPLENLNLLEEVDASRNGITDVTILSKLPNLKTIQLANNKIQKIPEVRKCRILNISGNEFEGEIDLGAFVFIESFVASYNKITEIRGFDRLASLVKLWLNNNEFNTIPNLSFLPCLQILNISANKIKKLDGVQFPKSLKTLEATNNLISEIVNIPISLSKINLKDNCFEKLPDLSYIQSLKWLHLGNNKIGSLCGSFFPEGIEQICLQNNSIDTFSDTNFPNSLKYIDLSKNHLSCIPLITGMKEISTIILSENKINQVNGIWNFENLSTIVIENNQLQSLEFLGTIPKLSGLWLDKNKIKDISYVCSYTGLKSLALSNNKIREIPSDLAALANLNVITVYGNHDLFKTIPKGILDIAHDPNDENRYVIEMSENFWEIDYIADEYYGEPKGMGRTGSSPKAIQQWIEAITQSPKVNKSIRLVFCGNGRVGKSSILDCLQERPFAKDRDSTHAIAVERLKLSDLECWVWDFGGQEIYHSTHRLFMGGNAVYVLVWDEETEKTGETSDSIDPNLVNLNFKLHYWVDFIRSESPDSPIIVVQNKSDNDWSFPSEEILPTTLNIRFITAFNAQSGRGKEQLEFFIQQAARSLPEYNMTVPETWWKVQDHLLTLKTGQEKPTMTFEEFDRICLEMQVNPSHTSVLKKYLQNVSTIYIMERFWDGVVIVNDMWLIQPIYKILERGTSFFDDLRSTGRFSKNRFREAINNNANYTEMQIELFLRIIQSIGLCFQINKPNVKNIEFIVPRFLINEVPEHVETYFEGREDETFFLQYVGSFHYHLIQQFIVATGTKTDLDKIGRRGIFFNVRNGIIAYIFADANMGTISTKVAGGHEEERKWVMDAIRLTFREIANNYTYKNLIHTLASYDGQSYASVQSINKQYELHKDQREIIKYLKVEAGRFTDDALDIIRLLWAMKPDEKADFQKLPDVEHVTKKKTTVTNQSVENMANKSVFISYSHKFPTTKDAVLQLADRLVAEGVDVCLDQYIHGDPPEGWTKWMQDCIDKADFILLVFTEDYKTRWDGNENPGQGLGVTRESIIINSKLYQSGRNNAKYRALILSREDRKYIPDILVSDYTSYCIPDDYDELYFLITGQPKVVKPQLGQVRKR